jgi:hypothetical protein
MFGTVDAGMTGPLTNDLGMHPVDQLVRDVGVP